LILIILLVNSLFFFFMIPFFFVDIERKVDNVNNNLETRFIEIFQSD